MLTGPRDHRHGTVNGYNNHDCRCDRCREAARVSWLERSHRLGWSEPRDVVNDRRRLLADLADNHGTETRYNRGCRCDGCRAAVAQARRTRREANREAYNAYERACWKRRVASGWRR